MSGDRYFIRDPDALYYLTPTVVRWLDVYTKVSYKSVIVDSLNFCIQKKGLRVHAWCLMSSHMHLISSAKEGFNLSHIIRDFKKYTANETIRLIKEESESRRNFF